MRSFVAAVAAAVVALSGGALGALAEVSFKGKTIQVGIGADPGGGNDRAGRLIARYLEKYLPGNPSTTISHFGAGGGKIRAANYLALEAPKDGTFLLQGDTSPLQPQVLKRDVVRYDPAKFKPIGAINRGGSVFFVRKDAHDRLTDPNAEPVVVGAISGTRSWQIVLLLAKEHMGWNLRWVPGYKGTSSLTAAIRQGEIDIFATNNVFIINSLVEDGVVDLLMQEGQATDNGNVPRADFPDVPIFLDMFAKTNPPEEALAAYGAVMDPGASDKWTSLPPGTPEEIVSAFRDAYAKTLEDPEFLKAAKKQLSPVIQYIPGKTVEKMFRISAGISDEAIAYGAKLRKKYDLSTH